MHTIHQSDHRYSRRTPLPHHARMLREVHPRARFVYDERDHHWHVVLERELRDQVDGYRYDHVMVCESRAGEPLEPCLSVVAACYVSLVRMRLNQHAMLEVMRENVQAQVAKEAWECTERKAEMMDYLRTMKRILQKRGFVEAPGPILAKKHARRLLGEDANGKLMLERSRGDAAPRQRLGRVVL